MERVYPTEGSISDVGAKLVVGGFYFAKEPNGFKYKGLVVFGCFLQPGSVNRSSIGTYPI